jgi:hypothetical protein
MFNGVLDRFKRMLQKKYIKGLNGSTFKIVGDLLGALPYAFDTNIELLKTVDSYEKLVEVFNLDTTDNVLEVVFESEPISIKFEKKQKPSYEIKFEEIFNSIKTVGINNFQKLCLAYIKFDEKDFDIQIDYSGFCMYIPNTVIPHVNTQKRRNLFIHLYKKYCDG